MRAITCGLAIAALAAVPFLAAPPLARSLGAQPAPTSAPTTPAPPTAVPPPPPDISGEWSITRSWWRSCPGCGMPIVRTTSWIITQRGSEVSVDRGPQGSVSATPGGGGLLHLEGLEQSGEGVLRFWYGTLRVGPGGNTFDGGFNGSERISNPCGSTPPIVTCFASSGYLDARRINPIATVPTPPGPRTAVPTAPSLAPSPSAPSTNAPSASATVSPTAVPAPSGTPAPPIYRRFIPSAGRQ